MSKTSTRRAIRKRLAVKEKDKNSALIYLVLKSLSAIFSLLLGRRFSDILTKKNNVIITLGKIRDESYLIRKLY